MEYIDNYGLFVGQILFELLFLKSKGKEEFKYVVVKYEKIYKQFFCFLGEINFKIGCNIFLFILKVFEN